MTQAVITTEQRAQLLANAQVFASGDVEEIEPVVRLFTPDAHVTWLLACLTRKTAIPPTACAIWVSECPGLGASSCLNSAPLSARANNRFFVTGISDQPDPCGSTRTSLM